jgi:hypothetical protein
MRGTVPQPIRGVRDGSLTATYIRLRRGLSGEMRPGDLGEDGPAAMSPTTAGARASSSPSSWQFLELHGGSIDPAVARPDL